MALWVAACHDLSGTARDRGEVVARTELGHQLRIVMHTLLNYLGIDTACAVT